MRKLFIILCFAGLLASCSDGLIDEQTNQLPVKVENGRMVFLNSKVLYETIDKLNFMDDDAKKNWSNQFGFNSFFDLSSNDESMLDDESSISNVPISFQRILNKNAEYQINDTIVWYNKGIKHFIPNQDESLLEKIKKNPELSTIKGEYFFSTFEERDTENARTTISLNGLDARHQREFSYYGNRRKYVHELYTYTETVGVSSGYTFHTELHLKIKLEWYGSSSRKWRPAGESRQMNYSINYSIRVVNINTGYTFISIPNSGYFTGNLANNVTRSSDVDLLIGSAIGTTIYPDYFGHPTWDVEISGSIYHKIVDDPSSSNAWTNSGYPLW